jgi:hypothetical protein
MTRSEFKQVGIDVFMELLPKTKMVDMQEFLSTFMAELEDQGLEIEDDEDLDENTETEDDEDFEG